MATVDLSSDPTYPRMKKFCPNCGHDECKKRVFFFFNNLGIFFQSRSKGKDATMKLYFACTEPNCKHRWEEGKE
jgi:DNA-directed RNA polymerase II subunit RPB9